jgi:aryl-alcohol dehydrogenase-like predicted oxidoreductase
MRSRPLGRTGLPVPVLALGAGRLGELSVPDREVEVLVQRALDLGVVLFDAARGYGAAEDRLGRLLEPHRDRVLLSTKVGYGIPGFEDWTGPCVSAGVDAALQRFRTDRLDIVHLHSCDLGVLQRGDVVEALRRAVEAGKVRVAAYSGEGEALDWAVRSGAFGSIQCSVSFLDQANLAGSVAEAARRGLGVLAKRSVGNAPWRFQHRPEAYDLGIYWDRFQALGLAGRDPKSLFETSLRFAAFSPGISAVLVGTASAEHLATAVQAVERGPLSDAARQELVDAFNRAGASWPGLI